MPMYEVGVVPSRCSRCCRAQTRRESLESGTATVADQDSPLLLISFMLVVFKVF